jgi:hypothetical protein
MRYLALAGVVAPVLSASAQAQTLNNVLRGLSEVNLIIEELDTASTICRLTESLFRNAVKYPVSFTKLRLNLDSSEIFYVRISTLYFQSDSACVSSIEVQVYSYESASLNFSGRDIRGQVRLWENGSLISSDLPSHAERVKQQIEDITKRFITDMNMDNKDSR